MKKLSIICALLLILGLISGPAFAIEYRIDILEPGNPGGWTASLKTFENKWMKEKSKEVAVDIWLHDVTEPLISGGFWIKYDPSKVSIAGVDVYDGSVLPGPWDRGLTKNVPDADGPGTYKVFCINMGNVTPDKKGDIIIAKVRFLCKKKCDTPITISTVITPGFDTIVGGNSGQVFDPKIKPVTIK